MNKAKKISFIELAQEFAKANEDGRVIHGVVVYSSSNWKTDYPLDSRSYATFSDQWGWDNSKMGHCRMGYALDGSEGIRMDYYNWKVDYCYLITEDEFNDVMKKYK